MIDSDRLVRFSRAEQNFLLFYVYFNCILYVFRKWKRPEKTKKKPRKKKANKLWIEKNSGFGASRSYSQQIRVLQHTVYIGS